MLQKTFTKNILFSLFFLVTFFAYNQSSLAQSEFTNETVAPYGENKNDTEKPTIFDKEAEQATTTLMSVCGDGICDISFKEDISSCPVDCGMGKQTDSTDSKEEFSKKEDNRKKDSSLEETLLDAFEDTLRETPPPSSIAEEVPLEDEFSLLQRSVLAVTDFFSGVRNLFDTMFDTMRAVFARGPYQYTWSDLHLVGATDITKKQERGGRIYAVWAQEGEIYFSSTDERGTLWRSPLNVSETGEDSSAPQLGVEETRLWIAWIEAAEGNGDIFLRSSEDGGDTFSSSRNMSESEMRSHDLDMAEINGSVYLSWQESPVLSGSTGAGAMIRPTAISLSGVTRSGIYMRFLGNPSATLVTNDMSARHPKITATSSKVAVGWDALFERSTTGTDYDIFLALSRDNGRTFVLPTITGRQIQAWSNHGPQYNIDLASAGERIMVLYEEQYPAAVLPTNNAYRNVILFSFTDFNARDVTDRRSTIPNTSMACSCNPEMRSGNVEPMRPSFVTGNDGGLSVTWSQHTGFRRERFVAPLSGDGAVGVVSVAR